MTIPLLFHKNRKLKYDNLTRTNCMCFKLWESAEGCLHPDSPFKYEGPDSKQMYSCLFQHFYGPTALNADLVTKEELDKMYRENTYCNHPDEIVKVEEWRCYRCNGHVSSERERHKCPF